ncbi:MAG: hypothetical protein IAE94_06965 [Chthoniobacterales bacterium]|nr:hypothetical protein [Chthoniobacterales bacterium]
MSLKLASGLLAGLVQFTALSAFSCGVEWKKPKTHFNGVNEFGNVSYWDQVGELDLGGETFPLIIGFRSDWENPSPYLGYGWFFGILDAHFIQRSSDSFDMIGPDGYTVPFGRDNNNPAILNGAKGWKAEVKTDTIIAHAVCGWKLVFLKGKLVSITTPKDRTINIQRDADGIATAVVEATTVLMKVQRDTKKNITDLVMGDRRIHFAQVEKPLIQSVNGTNIIGARTSAVGTITLPNGAKKAFDYAPNEKLEPTISIVNSGESPRIITWNPSNRVIISDGPWKYDVTSPEIPGHNAAIGRIREDAKDKKEFWHYDIAKGEERSVALNGATTTKKWFTSGLLNGKLRSIETTAANSSSHTLTTYSYNESGDLIRKISPSESFYRQYGDDHKTVKTFALDGTLLNQEVYDDQKRLMERRHSDGKVETFSYSPKETLKTILSPTGYKTEIVISNGKVDSYKIFAQTGDLLKTITTKIQ